MGRYDHHVDEVLGALAGGTRGVVDVTGFFGRVHGWVASRELPNGCFIVNTMAEFNVADPEIAAVAALYRAQVRSSLKVALARAERSG